MVTTVELRQGYSVQLTAHDGRTGLVTSGIGILPPVWPLSQRRFAVAFKRKFVAAGFKARVVRVTFSDVTVIS